MSLANVISLLILLAAVVGGAWGMYISLARKIDSLEEKNDEKITALDLKHDQKVKRVYDRQDEEMKLVYDKQKEDIEKVEREFMRVDAHNLSVQHIKEVMEIKSNATIQLFTSQLADLTTRVKELIERVNHKERNGSA